MGGDRRVRAYLTDALDLVERTALFRDSVDWDAVRGDAEKVLVAADSCADTHEFLTDVLKRAGGRHSGLTPPGHTLSATVIAALGPALPTGRVVDAVGYLRVPRQSGGPRAVRGYVRTGGQVLAELAAARPGGWIVDLRANVGGNMWPMLAVAAPLLPDGVLGHFEFPDSRYQAWSVDRGRVRLDGRQMARSSGPLAPGGVVPTAVLLSKHTASAGEAVALAFTAHPRVRLIGAPTAGLTTANLAHALPDGTRMRVTGSYYADHERRRITGPIPVDERTADGDREAPIAAALSWITA